MQPKHAHRSKCMTYRSNAGTLQLLFGLPSKIKRRFNDGTSSTAAMTNAFQIQTHTKRMAGKHYLDSLKRTLISKMQSSPTHRTTSTNYQHRFSSITCMRKLYQHMRTVYKWMEHLGFRYQPRKKCYYVDGHEKTEVIAYRRNFVRRYFKQEQRMFRWIQLPQ